MGISSAGIGSGLDVNGLVSQLLQLERQPLNSLNAKKQGFNNQLSAFGRIKSDLDAFKSAMNSLKLDSDFSATKASSSNTGILSATTSSSAVAGTYDITVSTLAQAGVKASAGQLTSNTAIGAANLDNGTSGTVTFTAGTKSFDVAVTDTDTLESIRDKINSALLNGDTATQTLATASVINTGTTANPSYKLVVASSGKGTENDVSITSGDTKLNAFLGFAPSQPAVDATFTVNGLSITRSSNSITDVIDGVTLNLASADNTKPLTLTVSRDTEAITKKVNDFISAYNKLSSTITSLHQKGGSLEADNSANSIIYELQNIFNTPAGITGNSYNWLAEIGVSFKKDGSLSLDSAAFTKALDTGFDNVVSLFTDSDKGFAHRLYNSATSMLDSGGIVDSRISGLNTSVKTLDSSMDRENVRLESVEKRLRTQYANLDSLLGTMKNTSSYLAAQLS